jgi:hypothetical protein
MSLISGASRCCYVCLPEGWKHRTVAACPRRRWWWTAKKTERSPRTEIRIAAFPGPRASRPLCARPFSTTVGLGGRVGPSSAQSGRDARGPCVRDVVRAAGSGTGLVLQGSTGPGGGGPVGQIPVADIPHDRHSTGGQRSHLHGRLLLDRGAGARHRGHGQNGVAGPQAGDHEWITGGRSASGGGSGSEAGRGTSPVSRRRRPASSLDFGRKMKRR